MRPSGRFGREGEKVVAEEGDLIRGACGFILPAWAIAIQVVDGGDVRGRAVDLGLEGRGVEEGEPKALVEALRCVALPGRVCGFALFRSRFWPADEWAPGRPQPSYDKQYVRDWLTSPASGWDRASGEPPPPLPDDVVERTRAKYVEAYERLTGRRFGRRHLLPTPLGLPP
jgi:hypothetical protein